MQLENTTKPNVGKKNKKCPHCNQFFSVFQVRLVFYPEKGAWYRLRKPTYTCPYCYKYIKSKHEKLAVSLIAFNVVLGFTLTNFFGLYSLVILVPTFVALVIVASRQKNDVFEFEARNI
ncbi:hypothetical protein D0C16_17455 [Cellvibrio sp. KY-GH-1]|nr:hypothetical protein D0C16_17455 [Cellvibrio sp. KY-GH-1]